MEKEQIKLPDYKQRALDKYPERPDTGTVLSGIVLAVNRSKRTGYELGYLQAVRLMAEDDKQIMKDVADARLFYRAQRKAREHQKNSKP